MNKSDFTIVSGKLCTYGKPAKIETGLSPFIYEEDEIRSTNAIK